MSQDIPHIITAAGLIQVRCSSPVTQPTVSMHEQPLTTFRNHPLSSSFLKLVPTDPRRMDAGPFIPAL